MACAKYLYLSQPTGSSCAPGTLRPCLAPSNHRCYFAPHFQVHDASRTWTSVLAPHPAAPMVPAPTWQEVLAVPVTGVILALPAIRTSMIVTPVSAGELLESVALETFIKPKLWCCAPIWCSQLCTFLILLPWKLRPKEIK